MEFHSGVQVVVDISTKTCGPCKMIYPKVVEMSLAYPDAVFLKINGDTDNNTRVSLSTELFRLMFLHSETVFILSLFPCGGTINVVPWPRRGSPVCFYAKRLDTQIVWIYGLTTSVSTI